MRPCGACGTVKPGGQRGCQRADTARRVVGVEIEVGGVEVGLVGGVGVGGEGLTGAGVDGLAQLLADAKEGHALGGHVHPLQGARVDPLVGFVLPHLEGAKAPHLDVIALGQGLRQRLKHLGDHQLGAGLRDVLRERHALDELRLVHDRSPPTRC